MKKIIAICLTFIIAGACCALLPASAYNVISPTAPTYTAPGYDDETRDPTRGVTQYFTVPFDPSEIRSDIDDIVSRIEASRKSNPDYSRIPFSRFTLPFTNKGKDDPNSPNYTGKVTSVTRDKSPHSPDTATNIEFAPILVAVIMLMGSAVFAGKVLNRKKEEED